MKVKSAWVREKIFDYEKYLTFQNCERVEYCIGPLGTPGIFAVRKGADKQTIFVPNENIRSIEFEDDWSPEKSLVDQKMRAEDENMRRRLLRKSE